MTTAASLEKLLVKTSLPPPLVVALASGAPNLWLGTNSSSVLAADLVLFHPTLEPSEVRARAVEYVGGAAWRLTVAAHDRPGLLADTAAVLANAGYSIASASAGTWVDLGLAVHSVTVDGPLPGAPDLRMLGDRLRELEAGRGPMVIFEPRGEATVHCSTEEQGRWLLQVHAADQVGLLWQICSELAFQGIGIQAAAVAGDAVSADDRFVVDRAPDVGALTKRLSSALATS